MTDRPKPLAGVRVLDLSQLIPGPMVSLHLADMGAEVIKIENPKGGDPMRHAGVGANAISKGFAALNRNKKSVALDLKDAAQRDTFQALAGTAGVVIEQFRPGVMDRLGLGYATLAARNPALVYTSITGYGQTESPLRDQAGHDINYLAYAGILDQIGAAGGPPVLSNFQIGDLAGGSLSAAMGILAALFDAARSGRGRHVDIAMTDCAMAHAVVPLYHIAEHGAAPERGRGQLSGGRPYYGVYRCADDRYFALGALEPKFWRAFCQAIERPDLIDRQREGGEALAAELRALFARRSRDDWAAALAGIDACLSPVLSPEEAIRHPHAVARGLVMEREHPAAGRYLGYALPIRFSDFAFTVEREAPELGADTDAILSALTR